MPHAQGMHKAHQLLYERFIYTAARVIPTMSAEEAAAHPVVGVMQRKLRAGTGVVRDGNMIAGQPEHCVASAFEEHDDNGCVIRGLRDLGAIRATHGQGKKRRRVRVFEATPEQKRAKRAGALYMDSDDDIREALRRLCNGIDLSSGVCLDEMDALMKQVKWHFIALDGNNRLIVNNRHCEAASIAKGNYGRSCCAVVHVDHDHCYVVENGDMFEHIRKSVTARPPGATGMTIPFSPKELAKLGLVRQKQGFVLDEDAHDAREIIRIDKKGDPPPFDELKPAIYLISRSSLLQLHTSYVDRFREVPCRLLTKREGRSLIEFSVFLDPHSRDRKVTFMCPPSFNRSPLYTTLVAEMMLRIGKEGRKEGDTEALARKYLRTGIGSISKTGAAKLMAVRCTPTLQTKQAILRKQHNACFFCAIKFTALDAPPPHRRPNPPSRDDDASSDSSASDDDEPVNTVVPVVPYYEHMRPHMDGGRDATVQNMTAVCWDCMKEKNAREREASAYRGVEREYTSTYNAAVRASLYPPRDPDRAKLHPARTLARNERVTDEVVPGNKEVIVDCVKSRRNVLSGECEYIGAGWPVFATPDDWEPYGGDPTKPGRYEVDTDDTTIFEEYGFYYHPTVCYGLKVGLIQPSQIKMQLIASRMLPRDYFQKPMRGFETHIEAAYKALDAKHGDPHGHLKKARVQALKDLCGNIFVGVNGKATTKFYEERITFSRDEACERRREPGCSVEERKCADSGRSYYVIGTVTVCDMTTDRRPIYDMVVQMERISVDVIARKIVAMGGYVKHFKTDAVAGSIPADRYDEEQFTLATYDYVSKWVDTDNHPTTKKQLRYTVEAIGELEYNYKVMCRRAPVDPIIKPVPMWREPYVPPPNTDTPHVLAAERRDAPPPPPPPPPPLIPFEVGLETPAALVRLASNMVDSGDSFFVTGEGGCGKTTFLTSHLVPELRKRNERYLIVTPTCKTQAALRGYAGCEQTETIQLLLKMYNGSFRSMCNRFGMDSNRPFHLIIDEVSMLDEAMLEMLNVIKHLLPNVRFWLFGDPEQLPPVNDDWLRLQEQRGTGVETYENTAAFLALVDSRRLRMTHCHRLLPGEEWYSAICKASRAGAAVPFERFPVKKKTWTNICFTNRKALEVNLLRQADFLAEHEEFEPVHVPRNMPLMPDLDLIPGARLVGTAKGESKPRRGQGCPQLPEDVTHKIVKRERYIVKEVDANELLLQTFESEHETRVRLKTECASKFLTLGWAFTIHCSQGATFNEDYTIFEINRPRAGGRARNVSLTRARHGSQVQIDMSDRHLDTLRPPPLTTTDPIDALPPSQRQDRWEFIDDEAWLELCERACLELEADSPGAVYLARIQAGVKRRVDDESGVAEYYIPTQYRIATGRRTAYCGGITLQAMATPIRTVLLARRGHDLDLRSAHPTLMLQYLEKHEGAPDTPHLREYVAARAAVHARIASELRDAGGSITDDADVKKLAMRVMFLGKMYGCELDCPSLVDLAADFSAAAEFIVSLNPQALDNAKERHRLRPTTGKGPEAGAVSEVLCTIETAVVGAIEDCFVRECGMCVRALIYDGLVAHRVDPNDDTIDLEHLRLAERRVLEATGYAVELVEKKLYRAGSVSAAMEYVRTLSA